MNKLKEKKFLLFLLPSLILLSIFTFYPILKVVLSSFFFNGEFVFFENYVYVLGQDAFVDALKNTLLYTFVVTFVEMIIALAIAYGLSEIKRFRDFFQTIYFLPYVTSIIAIGAVFKIIFHSDYGILNQLLNAINIESVGWLTNPDIIMASVIILGIWKGLAFNVLIIFTGMSTIDKNLEKAAIIDGFSSVQTFIKIKLPQIIPILLYLVTMNFIFNIKVYEEVVALFGTTPGPGSSANTLVYMLYNATKTDPSSAAVISIFLFLIIIFFRFFGKLLTRFIRGGNYVK